MSGGIIGTLVLIYAGFTALLIASAVSIVRKAGYSAWWVCAGLVPLVNIVMLFAFAFSDWPALRVIRLGKVDAGQPAGHPGFSYTAASPAEPPAPAHTPPPRFSYREGPPDGGAFPPSGSILPGR
jgi:hypothetical protein